MNLISAVTWSWRALRGQSVTFAGLFASGVLGLSIVSGFRHLLSRWGAPWYVWLLVPIFAVGYIAKKETEWLPEPGARRKWARRIFFGSLVLALLIAWLRPARPGTGSAANEPPANAGGH